MNGSADITQSQPRRLVTSLAWLALLATVAAVAGHTGQALSEAGEGPIPAASWLWAAAHLAAAMAALPLGYLALSWAYPRRGLAREAAANPAAAVQASAHLLGATVVACVSFGGCDAQSLAVAAVFCLLGWAALAAICAAHRLVTRYRDHEEIAAGNTAAAIASGGLHLAVAIVVGHAISGQFAGWGASLRAFAITLAWVAVLFPLREVVLARLILRLRPRDMDMAISARRDPWLASAEALCYVLSALAVAGL